MDYKTKIRTILQNGDTKREDILIHLTGYSDRQMRKLIADEMPDVGSSHRRGYFLIKTEQDLQDSMSDLKSKARAIFVRAEKQHNAFGVKFQPELIFKGG